MLDLNRGGDLRCFIMDNRRPIHLANVYSNYNVVVLDDDIEFTSSTILSDGSDLSCPEEDSDAYDNREVSDFIIGKLFCCHAKYLLLANTVRRRAKC